MTYPNEEAKREFEAYIKSPEEDPNKEVIKVKFEADTASVTKQNLGFRGGTRTEDWQYEGYDGENHRWKQWPGSRKGSRSDWDG